MKKTKKLLALVLAMMMAFSVMAMTAAAYDAEDGHVHTEACSEEGIMPRIPAMDCYKCHVPMIYETKGTLYRMVCPNYSQCGNITGWITAP